MAWIIGIGFSQNNKTRDELKSPVRKSFNNPMVLENFLCSYGANCIKPSFSTNPLPPWGKKLSTIWSVQIYNVSVWSRKTDLEGRLRCPVGAKGW
jgi:hypothetical protein